MEFTIKNMIGILVKRFVFIIVCTMIGFMTFFFTNRFIIRPAYTASIQMYVDPYESSSMADLTELNYAQKIVNTYINFLQTKQFYRRVLEESGLDYTVDQLKEMTRIQTVNNTEIFQIDVTTYDPVNSFNLVDAMQKIAPVLIKEIKNTAQISVVDPVILPNKASSPNIILNTVLGGMLGFLLSVLIAFLLEVLDVKLKNQEDLQKRYQLPILGVVPDFGISIRKIPGLIKIILKRLYKKVPDEIEKSNPVDNEFFIMESYKALRTNLRFTLLPKDCQKIIVSSPVPEDGKSTTSTNMGITIAQTGARVLLIDCDLRKGKLHSFFQIKNGPGVSDLLSGLVSINEVIQKTTYDNLFVIPAGSIAPNPTELLSGVQMEDLLEKLEFQFDYIIMDTPPVNVVSDSLSLVKLVDGVVVVVRERRTSHPNIISALDKFKFAEAKMLGFVINGVSINHEKMSKSYSYYYH